MFMTDYVLSTIGVLLSVAFFTLMERKIMGISQYRKGPTKVMVWGILQPITDATKLMSKETMKLENSKTFMYMSGPCFAMGVMLLCWSWFNFSFNLNSTTMSMMMIIATLSISAYGFLMMSWGSNSKYSMMGGHRAVSQIISYEVCLVLFLLIIIYINKSLSMKMLPLMQENMWMMMVNWPMMMLWMTMCMAEANRTPFDFSEGESEIVSGFNIEYGGGQFALIFISEYGMIMFMSFMTSMMMSGSSEMMKTLMVSIVFIWVRCAFPRMRYDKLMMMCWKIMLPLTIVMIMWSLSMTNN